ncbi:protein Wiz isoform X2 [Melanotaenia boesemani]|uniref:protein Wiz isoform X2 n=1 Tax=Melanotaenia boesemani TaxID=1250792 RepID=UPI001C058065|nr:protein Wiz isoform X2 [Melanotaenia boesemani]
MEEQQNFSNPHGLAAHSPGSPSSGLRLGDEDDQEPENLQPFHSETDTSAPVGGPGDNTESTKTEEPNTSQLGQTELADSKVWNVSEGAEPFLSKAKPKEGCQVEEEVAHSEREMRSKGSKTKEPERDVYTFPGDSDPESPPPAPWAHCTFIQRCRKKRVLLRPFSGLGTFTPPELARAKTAEDVKMNRGEGVYDFEEVGFGEKAVETIKFRDKVGKRDQEEEESTTKPSKEIFTCVECSIYFKKQVHLQEHMAEHRQSGVGGGRRSGKGHRFRCNECGWNLPNRLVLADHHRRHQESRLKILEEIEKLNENRNAKEMQTVVKHALDPNVTQYTGLVSNQGKMSDPEIGRSPPLSPASVSTPSTDKAVLNLDTAPPNSARTATQPRTVSGYRRRFVCSKCNFSTRTPQALTNHSKIHNRKKYALQADSPSPETSSGLASTSLACGHCAFLASSQTILREHHTLVHPGKVSISGEKDDQTGQSSRSNLNTQMSKIPQTSEQLSDSLPVAAQDKSQQEITASEDNTPPESAAALSSSPGVFKCASRSSTRGKAWTDPAKFSQEMEDDGPPGIEEEEEVQRRDLNSELSQQEGNSPVGGNLHNTDDSSRRQSPASSPPAKKAIRAENKLGVERERKVFFLRRSSRVTAAPAHTDSDNDDDDIDDERVRCFLSDEDKDEIDEDEEAAKSVERKCPYCPDRFHNGIGLANHVRGHLNRVGVSYNVRHFISPEEVNAIEKKFSYQKKKKKVANFDPDTFSVMHCEFCSAGFDTRAGLSSHARAHLRDFGITNWDVTISPIHILRELFSSRPDLVIPTAPPKSPGSSLEEEEDDEEEEGEDEEEKDSEEEGIIEVKLEGETSERPVSASESDKLASVSHQGWKKEEDEDEGDEEEAAEEEDEDDLQLSALDGLNSSGNADSLFPEEDADDKVNDLKCEVCDSEFESRRGLSSHARSHLRQLGITVSESSGAPINLLYQISKERDVDGKISSSHLEPLNHSPSAPLKHEEQDDMDLDEKPIPLSILAKAPKAVPPSSSSPTSTSSSGASPALSHSGSPSSVVKKAPISSLLPVSSPLRSPEHKAGGIKSLTPNLSATSTIATAKPLWAPQESDAPLNLTLEVDPNKDIVCQLCGAWFETRKGLSSHARAHLRHFGVEYSESKGSPIDLLNQLIDTDDFKHKASTLQLDSHTEPRDLTTTLPSPKQALLTLASSSSSLLLYKVTAAGGGSTSKSTSSSASSLSGPPPKRLKASSMQVFRLSSGELMALPHNEPPKEIGCEFCGEYFENRKGLSSHARSHLRQMGITEWSVNGSPIDTLREVITRRGLPCALPLKPLKTPPSSSPGPPRSPLSPSTSPSATCLGRLPFAFARPSSPPHSVLSKSSPAPPSSSSGLILKLKPEPVQLEVTAPATVGRSGGFSTESLNSGWSSSDNMFPLNLAMAHEVEPTRDIRCEFCGEYFENRKGLSSHARSHLRQMGITEWSVNGSPIDTLREVMHKRGIGGSSHSDHGVKKESSQVANSPSWESVSGARSSEGLGVLGYQSSKFRKSPLSLLQPGSKYQKQGLGRSSAIPSAGKFFRMSPLGKRPLSEEAKSVETVHSSPHRLKAFSPLPQDFSLKRKPSPDKPGHQDPSCELCGFYFENRKALASHARAHLRQFGVTEWSVNGSPIETLSAWMRSRPQRVLEMHRSYMQGNRSGLKKKAHSSSSSSSTQWSSSLAVSLVRPLSREVSQGSSKTTEDEAGTSLHAAPIRPGRSSPSFSRLGGGLPLQAQVARSELNVRLPRGFERRPLKHPSFPDGTERDSGTPKPPRTGTVPALVPKPPSYPLVKLVGKVYTLKCRFCEVEFHGPLSVQEDWIRHLQQHILKMNYDKAAPAKAATADDQALIHNSAPASTSTSRTTSTPTRSTAPNSRSPTPLAECAPAITAAEIVKVSEEQPSLIPTSIPLPTQTA